MSSLQVSLTGTPVNNAAPVKPDKQLKPSTTTKQGTVYVSNGGYRYEEQALTPETLKKYAESYYGTSLILKIINLIIPGAPEIKAFRPDGQEDELVSEELMAMSEAPGVRLYEKMRFTLFDVGWAGFSINNDIWDYDGPVYTLKELRRLPPESFNSPSGNTDYTDVIFPGVCIEDDERQFWQTDDYGTKRITDCFYLLAPISRDIAGTALIKPLIPVIAFLQQSLKAVWQTVDRTGCPWIFIRVGPEYSQSDLKYVDDMLAGYGKDTGFKLLPNMEIVNHGMPEPKTPVEAINLLSRMLIEYFSPANFIQNDSATLSSSDVSSLRLLNQWIIGMQNWIEDGYERLLQRYLDGNLYQGYHVEITLPRPQEDKTDLLLKVLDGINKAGIAKDEELRAILPDYTPELTPEEMIALQAERKARQPVNTFGQIQQPTQPEMVANARIVQMLQESLKA